MIDLPNFAFIGRMGAGKSTCAQLLEAYHYRNVPMAWKLKEIAVDLWGKEAFSDRDKLQKLGVFMRGLDEDVWVNAALKRMDGIVQVQDFGPEHKHRFTCDDVRFPNEYAKLRERGFLFVRVACARNERVLRLQANGKLQDEGQLEHESETQLDDDAVFPADYYLDTSLSNLDELKATLHSIISKEAGR